VISRHKCKHFKTNIHEVEKLKQKDQLLVGHYHELHFRYDV